MLNETICNRRFYIVLIVFELKQVMTMVYNSVW
jgi:hypothetical protein